MKRLPFFRWWELLRCETLLFIDAGKAFFPSPLSNCWMSCAVRCGISRRFAPIQPPVVRYFRGSGPRILVLGKRDAEGSIAPEPSARRRL
jgi:hypothetical protein